MGQPVSTSSSSNGSETTGEVNLDARWEGTKSLTPFQAYVLWQEMLSPFTFDTWLQLEGIELRDDGD